MAAFFRFARAYGRLQCDAREYYFYLQDVFGQKGTAEIAPKLAQLIKETDRRMDFIRLHAGVTAKSSAKSTGKTQVKKGAEESEQSIFQQEDDVPAIA